MKKKYKIILVSAALILFVLILLLVKNHANKSSNYSKIVVSDGLSINYLDGDKIVASPSKSNKYVFSITNDSSSEKYYKVDLDNFAFNENVKYTLVCKETGINYEDVSFTSSALIDYVVINPGETHNYTLTIAKNISRFEIGILDISKYTFEQQYFAQTVIANNIVSQDPKTSVGSETSTTDEGLVQDLDDDGVTYYFRGNVQDNYVKFADMMWRIVRINGNNTVRLVLNDSTEDLVEYYTDNSNNYFAYGNTNVKSYLNGWYNANLSLLDRYIATTKVCDDSAYTGNDQYVFSSSQRLSVNHEPTFNCLGSKINSKISLLSADEIEYAGALIGVSNENYYLYNPNITNPVWTMTPSKGNQEEFYPYALSTSGSLDDSQIGNQKKAVRPVINIRKDISVIGKGTINEPYELLF